MPADGEVGSPRHQRARIWMSDAAIAEFLDESSAMSMASLNGDGTIHLVAMWYVVIDGAITCWTKAKSQKVQNLRRNPAVTCLVEDGVAYDELRGVQIAGTAEIFDDHDQLLAMGKRLFERRFGRYSDEHLATVEQMMHKRVGIVVHPSRIASWDHTLL
jgi:PPOX class probable F420-dependent enzyme